MSDVYCFLMVLPHSKETTNTINLCSHKDDFGVDPEWPYFAVSHVMELGNSEKYCIKASL